MILYHYTDEKGLQGIISNGELLASTATRNPRDVRYGHGQYLSDIKPGAKTPAQLSRVFLNLPYFGHRFTHYVAIDISGLPLMAGRPGGFVVPNEETLALAGRIVAYGNVSNAPQIRGTLPCDIIM